MTSELVSHHWSHLVSRFVAGCTRHADVAEADGWCVLIGRSREDALVTADDAALQLLDYTVGHVFGQGFTVPAHLILSRWKIYTNTQMRTRGNNHYCTVWYMTIIMYSREEVFIHKKNKSGVTQRNVYVVKVTTCVTNLKIWNTCTL